MSISSQSSVDCTLDAELENLTLTGTADVDGVGNDMDNILIGNAGDNVLTGSDGDDTLHGDAGADVLDGGIGDDVLDGGTGADSMIGGAATICSSSMRPATW